MNILNSLLDCSILFLEGILAFYFLAAFLPETNSSIQAEEIDSPVIFSKPNAPTQKELLPIATLPISEAEDNTLISIKPTVLTVKQLVSIAKEHKVPGYSKMKKQQLQQTLSDLQICCQLQPA